MAWNDYLNIVSAGLAANRPTSPDKPELPRVYIATDTGSVSLWNPTARVWAANNGSGIPATIASAGATQGGATAVVNQVTLITTATASSKGVKLPVATTGLEVTLVNKGPTFGVKVYPNTGGFINAGASNAADTALAALKTTVYLAIDGLHWVTMRGA